MSFWRKKSLPVPATKPVCSAWDTLQTLKLIDVPCIAWLTPEQFVDVARWQHSFRQHYKQGHLLDNGVTIQVRNQTVLGSNEIEASLRAVLG